MPCAVEKLILVSHERLISRKIEVYIGRYQSSGSGAGPSAKGTTIFDRLGYLTFHSNQNNLKHREKISCDIKRVVSFIRLLVHENYSSDKNAYNQVGIAMLEITTSDKIRPRTATSSRGSLIPHSKESVTQSQTISTSSLSKPTFLSPVSSIPQTVRAVLQKATQITIFQKQEAAKNEDYFHAAKMKRAETQLSMIIGALTELVQKKDKFVKEEAFLPAQELKMEITKLISYIGDNPEELLKKLTASFGSKKKSERGKRQNAKRKKIAKARHIEERSSKDDSSVDEEEEESSFEADSVEDSIEEEKHDKKDPRKKRKANDQNVVKLGRKARVKVEEDRPIPTLQNKKNSQPTIEEDLFLEPSEKVLSPAEESAAKKKAAELAAKKKKHEEEMRKMQEEMDQWRQQQESGSAAPSVSSDQQELDEWQMKIKQRQEERAAEKKRKADADKQKREAEAEKRKAKIQNKYGKPKPFSKKNSSESQTKNPSDIPVSNPNSGTSKLSKIEISSTSGTKHVVSVTASDPASLFTALLEASEDVDSIDIPSRIKSTKQFNEMISNGIDERAAGCIMESRKPYRDLAIEYFKSLVSLCADPDSSFKFSSHRAVEQMFLALESMTHVKSPLPLQDIPQCVDIAVAGCPESFMDPRGTSFPQCVTNLIDSLLIRCSEMQKASQKHARTAIVEICRLSKPISHALATRLSVISALEVSKKIQGMARRQKLDKLRMHRCDVVCDVVQNQGIYGKDVEEDESVSALALPMEPLLALIKKIFATALNSETKNSAIFLLAAMYGHGLSPSTIVRSITAIDGVNQHLKGSIVDALAVIDKEQGRSPRIVFTNGEMEVFDPRRQAMSHYKKSDFVDDKDLAHSALAEVHRHTVEREQKKSGKKPQKVEMEREVSVCEFCGWVTPDGTPKEALESTVHHHIAKDCPLCTVCPLCNTIVEIPCMFEHVMEECPANLPDKDGSQKFVQCEQCSLVFRNDEIEEHMKDCSTILKEGEFLCPLCHDIIPDDEKELFNHYVAYPGCSRNPRMPMREKFT
ncbi:hypothetical protein ADUPG1_011496 [Aduncisulcus paluster]|uniref:Uncharacterized protein n=1 Tax=Aduncisulcus paluster TaxID=2918883 RepID=A0ABQ5JZB0_9EUKA|nr:hypothetical protein ADUPG1_011496 [Aduncisulcus paluster]